MNAIVVRKANAADLETLKQFEQGIIGAERPFNPTLKDDPVHYYNLDEMLSDSQTLVLLAEAEGQIVACGYSRTEAAAHYVKHQQHAYLGMMYVRPEYRGQGFNAMIMRELKKHALENGITELRLEVFVGNKSAVKAYEKFGFEAHIIQMRMGI